LTIKTGGYIMDLKKAIEDLGIDLETWNPDPTRRAARDLLNKTQKKEDILKVALILGAKIKTEEKS